MSSASDPILDAPVDMLKLLCAQASVSGQSRGLTDGADAVATLLRDVGLDCRVIPTAGAPIVLGRYDAGAPRTLLLYGRYDVPHPGLRRSWTADPFQPAVRDGALFARGAVAKGELVARAAALRTLITRRVPVNIIFAVEGESLIGSPHLSEVQYATGDVDATIWSGGGFDADSMPLLYTGTKGLLQTELQVTTAKSGVPATYAATVPNPIWTLVLILASIKSEFEEILIDGFYDEVAPPSRPALNAVQRLDVGEQARRDAWGVEQFIANVRGPMLARTETFSPTCNISAVQVTGGDSAAIPQRATASVQFQLVPDLKPDRLLELLRAHFETRGFTTLKLTQLPGAYPPMAGPEPATNLGQAAVPVYGKYAQVVPLTPFAAPAALLAPGKPFVSCGLERPTSNLVGPDEHIPLADLEAHTRLLIELAQRLSV